MQIVHQRIGKQYSTVYITFLSVLIGFALEDLISIVRETQGMYEVTGPAALMWVKAATVLTFIVVAWVSYTQIAMCRYSAPTPTDALNVLGFTITLFLLNSVITASMAAWYFAITLYIIMGGLSAYFSVELLHKDGPEFREYIHSVQTWKGPLLINYVGVPWFAALGFASLYETIDLSMHLSVLVSGWILVIVWGAMMFLRWRKFVLLQ